ncbi:Hypothetical protein PFR_JS12-1_1914 [Propionibacterium freudenreichii]|nr:Hypothetical protein PFR_JS12-2_1913 [Propionibacterium freudenreichii]SCC97882.1 Hypothetical protein PFR_JS12-1_1914 [Propionibacterium freudenreichii]
MKGPSRRRGNPEQRPERRRLNEGPLQKEGQSPPRSVDFTTSGCLNEGPLQKEGQWYGRPRR